MTLLILLQGCFKAPEGVEKQSWSLTSPDGRLQVVLNNSEEGFSYALNKLSGVDIAESLVLPSYLGFDLKINQQRVKLHEAFKVANVSQSATYNEWQTVWGEQRTIINDYQEIHLDLRSESSPNYQVSLTFRVFNDGLGFRYTIPEQDNIKDLVVMDELTEFNFAGDHKSWWIENDWDSYEYVYKSTPLSDVDAVSTPFTMKTAQGTHLSVHEAALVNYSGMALTRQKGTQFISSLAPWANSDIKVKGMNGPLKSLTTPWRTILVADSAATLAQSTLVLNLNEPNKIEDTSWIKPQKYMGIWWEMHIDVADWGRHNNRHGATTENAKRYIDFIHEHLIKGTDNESIGLLVEGWNIGWDGQWWDNWDKFEFTESAEYPDFDLSEVVEYGRARGVNYVMHNETSGGIVNYDQRMDAAYKDYERLGIHAIKSGYVADNGMKNPAGEHHHGQYMVDHYSRAVIKAAKHKIMINTHEPIKDTGLRRTYPNWMTREGVQGQEYNAWSAGNPPEHATILPFTRNLSGPVDYTPGVFDVMIPSKPENRVHSTRAKQLAISVLYFSPLQMITDLPQNYLQSNGKPYPEFQFLVDLKVDWDKTVWLDSEIGDYAAVARKARNKDEWFLAAVTDENPRTLKLPLSFLGDGQYIAQIYADGDDADYDSNPTSVAIAEQVVDAKSVLSAKMIKSGGYAVRLIPKM